MRITLEARLSDDLALVPALRGAAGARATRASRAEGGAVGVERVTARQREPAHRCDDAPLARAARALCAEQRDQPPEFALDQQPFKQRAELWGGNRQPA